MRYEIGLQKELAKSVEQTLWILGTSDMLLLVK